MIYIAQTSFTPRSILRSSAESPYARTSYRTLVPDSEHSCIARNQEYMSKTFERWKELASLTSKEQDPAKLAELASEMNLVLTQKTLRLDPPLREPLE